jgi:hypothetical protein
MWVSEWFPMAKPSRTIRRMISGCAIIRSPVTKKVAGTWCSLSRSSSLGVQTGSGPSSNVREIVRWAAWL